MSVAEEELNALLEEMETLSPEEEVSFEREESEIPRIEESLQAPRRGISPYWIPIAFAIGLCFGLTLSWTYRQEMGKQLTYIIQKISDLENSKDLIEPLDLNALEARNRERIAKKIFGNLSL